MLLNDLVDDDKATVGLGKVELPFLMRKVPIKAVGAGVETVSGHSLTAMEIVLADRNCVIIGCRYRQWRREGNQSRLLECKRSVFFNLVEDSFELLKPEPLKFVTEASCIIILGSTMLLLDLQFIHKVWTFLIKVLIFF